jgi:hypothetical protein
MRVPQILYGTAWKEDQTQRLTELALRRAFAASTRPISVAIIMKPQSDKPLPPQSRMDC